MTFVLGVFSLAGCQPPKCNWLCFPVHVRPPEPGQLRRQASGDRQLRAQLRNPIECSQPQNICGGDPTPPDQLTCSRVICTLGLSVTDSATTQSEPAHETPARGPSSAAADQPAKPAGAVAAAIPGPFPCLSLSIEFTTARPRRSLDGHKLSRSKSVAMSRSNSFTLSGVLARRYGFCWSGTVANRAATFGVRLPGEQTPRQRDVRRTHPPGSAASRPWARVSLASPHPKTLNSRTAQ